MKYKQVFVLYLCLFSCFLIAGGPYATFAGRDASRNLATFKVTPNDNDDFDDLSDLTAMEMDSMREWEMQFKGECSVKYTLGIESRTFCQIH